jgi:dienelactone hydrolase
VAVLWVSALCACAQPVEPDDDAARTFWEGCAHFVHVGSLHEEAIQTAWPSPQRSNGGRFRATIVYLHGCDGVGVLGIRSTDWLAAAGYLARVPDSFARRDKPCR